MLESHSSSRALGLVNCSNTGSSDQPRGHDRIRRSGVGDEPYDRQSKPHRHNHAAKQQPRRLLWPYWIGRHAIGMASWLFRHASEPDRGLHVEFWSVILR